MNTATKVLIGVGITSAIGVTAIGGLGIAAWQGWIQVPSFGEAAGEIFASDEPPTIVEMMENMQEIETANVALSLDLASEPRDEDVEVLDVPVDDFSASYLTEIIPTDVRIQGTWNTQWNGGLNTESITDVNQQSQVSGSYESDGLSVSLDIEAITLDANAYLKMNTFPSILFDTGPIKEQWVELPELSESGLIAISSAMTDSSEDQVFGSVIDEDDSKVEEEKTDLEELKDESEQIRVELVDFFTQAVDEGVVTVDTQDEDAQWHIVVKSNGQQLRDFYTTKYEAHKESRDTEYPSLYDEEVYEFMLDEEANSATDAVLNNTTVDFYVNKENRYPSEISITNRIAPSNSIEKFAGLQFRTTFSMALSNVNEPIDIQVPADAISYTEAARMLSGISDEGQRFYQQVKNIEDIRESLETYKLANGEYPEILDEMVGIEVSSYYSFSDTTKEVQSIPADIFLGYPFQYNNTVEGDYELSYEMAFPAEIPSYETYLYVEGVNTATSITISEEASVVTGTEESYYYDDYNLDVIDYTSIDSDNDGLTDEQESIYGTDPFLADTDRDGFSDKDEIDGGYDPIEGVSNIELLEQ